jgi:hypothetical protein
MSDPLDALIRAIALREGRSEAEVAREFAQRAIPARAARPVPAPTPRPLPQVSRPEWDVDEWLSRGTRSGGGGVSAPQEREETSAEAYERWLDQEQRDFEGAYGPGGSTAGGIFGEGAVVLSDYDPHAHQRTESRLLAAARGRNDLLLAQVLERLVERLPPPDDAAPLPAPPNRKRLK